MKIALPLNEKMSLYFDNPHTAPRFAIYNIEGTRDNIRFSLSSIVQNPWHSIKCNDFEEEQLKCNCSDERKNSIKHKCEHYSILESIKGCTYLLAYRYCLNTKQSLKNSGIKVLKVPPIINTIDMAIKNFLIGASLASTIKHIHHAS